MKFLAELLKRLAAPGLHQQPFALALVDELDDLEQGSSPCRGVISR